MIARCSPLFEYSPTALIVITFAGYDVIPCGNHWNITERSKEGHSLFNLQSIRLYDLACASLTIRFVIMLCRMSKICGRWGLASRSLYLAMCSWAAYL
uniref:Uncharacterized protein n=1 Tax=Salix viminalis TaxID=40686 RepID=A0A6N2LBN6_SALVM